MFALHRLLAAMMFSPSSVHSSLGLKDIYRMICHLKFIITWILLSPRLSGNVFYWDFVASELGSQQVLKWTCYESPRCEHFGFSNSSCIFWSSEMWFVVIFIKPYKHFISFHLSFWASSKLILTFTKWGGVACETTSVHNPQCNLRPQWITSVNICSTMIPHSMLSASMS